jgi:thymidylate synthase (FAD)
MQACQDSETYYFGLLQAGCTPQEAREVLPLSLKTELVMSGFVSDWQHFFNLRTSIIAETGKPHPDASRLADPLYEEFINRKLIYAQK